LVSTDCISTGSLLYFFGDVVIVVVNLLLFVSVGMKVFEKIEKEYGLHESVPGKGGGEVALDEQQLQAVQTNKKELNHLENGQVFLPPQIFLELRTHRCHEIIEVHDEMDQRIEGG
jgi:hypothetical protein